MPSYQGEAGAPQATQAAGGSAPDQNKSYPQAPQDQTERMVILTQTLRLKVDDTAATIAAVREVADKHSAIVANMRMASEGEWVYDSPAGSYTPLRGWLTVRVPVDGVKAFVDEVSGLGEVVYQAETSDDVTQEHVDLSARLENLRAQETRLRELVAQAANVEETLAVEQELWRVRGEIESLDAQVKYLERQAAMATITVELAEEGPVVQNWGFVEALGDGIRAAAAVLAFTISFTIATSPLWILGLVIFFLVRRCPPQQGRHAASQGQAGQDAKRPTRAGSGRPDGCHGSPQTRSHTRGLIPAVGPVPTHGPPHRTSLKGAWHFTGERRRTTCAPWSDSPGPSTGRRSSRSIRRAR